MTGSGGGQEGAGQEDNNEEAHRQTRGDGGIAGGQPDGTEGDRHAQAGVREAGEQGTSCAGDPERLHRRLEERSAHITEQIDLLGARSVEVASSLEPLRESSKTVDTALKVSAGLPVVKRKMAHRKIDDQLDELEEALVQFVMAGLGNAE